MAGRGTVSMPPERATVHVSMTFEGPEPHGPLSRTTELANQLGTHLAQLRAADPSPTTWSAMLPIRTRSWRPFSGKGKVTSLVHVASCQARVKFRDFGALSAFVDGWGGVEGMTIVGVSWTLTEATRREQEANVQRQAVDQARERAQVLAVAAGAMSVRFVELADPGLLGGQQAGAGAPPHAMALRAGAPAPTDSGPVELSPEDIEMSAIVHARFVTEG